MLSFLVHIVFTFPIKRALRFFMPSPVGWRLIKSHSLHVRFIRQREDDSWYVTTPMAVVIRVRFVGGLYEVIIVYFKVMTIAEIEQSPFLTQEYKSRWSNSLNISRTGICWYECKRVGFMRIDAGFLKSYFYGVHRMLLWDLWYSSSLAFYFKISSFLWTVSVGELKEGKRNFNSIPS